MESKAVFFRGSTRVVVSFFLMFTRICGEMIQFD